MKIQDIKDYPWPGPPPVTEPQAAIAEPDARRDDWMARLHADEVRYWAQRLELFEMRLPSLRRNHLGDAGSLQMVRDVLAAIRATQGRDIARQACRRLMDAWRDGGEIKQ